MQWKTEHLKGYVITFFILFCLFSSFPFVYAFDNEQGLVAYYNFDEDENGDYDENITYNLTGNCNDGIIYGAKHVEGNFGEGLNFDGKNDYVDCGNNESLDVGTTDFTVEVWAKANDGIFGRGIINKGGWHSIGYFISEAYCPNNTYFFGVRDNASYKGVALPLHEKWNWTHIVGIKTNNHLEAWVNGIKVGEWNGDIGSLSNPDKKFEIGRSFDGYYFNGTIDEVKIYNRALTDAEVKKEYKYYTSLYNTLKSINSSCSKNSECKTNNCFKGVCRDMRYCENDSNCLPCYYCDINISKCRLLKPIGIHCFNDSECETKICDNGVCAEKRGEILKKSKNECNFDFDCPKTQYCDKDNKCKNLKDENYACSRDAECKTGYCYSGVCRGEDYVKIWNFIITPFQLLFTFLVFFLPGFAITLIKRGIPLSERIVISVGLGIALNILGIFVLNKFGVPVDLLYIVFLYSFSFVVFGVLFYYFYYFKGKDEEFEIFIKEKIINLKNINLKNIVENNKIKILKLSLLIFTLLFVFFIQYGIHFDYNYPFHTDEWQHLARAVQIMETNTIPDVDPYYNKYPVGEMNLEVGFHVFLAEFYILSNQDPVLFYKFFPAIFAVLASLMLFLLVRKITKNFYAGILSVLFFASLKSTIGILGVWFFVPLSMSFMFVYLFFYLYIEGMIKNSVVFLFFSVIVISATALIHPQSASWIYPVIVVYLLLFILRNILKINMTNILKFKNAIFGNILLFSLPFISFIYFFKILWKGSFETTLNYFLKEFIVFRGCPAERGVCEPNFIVNFYGMIAFILAIVGVVYLIHKFIKGKGADKFDSLILLSWVFVITFLISTLHVEIIGKAVASLMQISYSPFTLLVAYTRLIYETFLLLAVLSGIGLYAIIKFIYLAFKNLNIQQKQKGVAFISIIFVIFVIVFASTFIGYYDMKVKIYKNINDDDYKAIKWIEKNFGNHNVILARAHISETIYPISKNYVVAITPHANIPTTGERNADVYSFFMGDCNTKKEILNKYNVDLVVEKYPLKCYFLKEIYNNGTYVYMVEKG